MAWVDRVPSTRRNPGFEVSVKPGLAVDKTVQGRGIGAFLLRDAMSRAVSVAEQAGIRLLLVHAVDDKARSFYEHFEFEGSPSDPMNLQLLIKDIRIALDDAD